MMTRFLAAALLTGAGFAQTQERILHFAHTDAQTINEVTNAVRVIPQIGDVTSDVASGTLTMRGTASEIDTGAWVFTQLDKAPVGQPPAQHSSIDYTIPGVPNAAVRVFYLAHTETPQSMQEMINAIRSVADLQYAIPVNGPRAMVFRGTPAQLAVAAFIVDAFDRHSAAPAHATPPGLPVEYAPAGVVRVFYAGSITGPRDLQEIVNAIRSVADIQRFFPYNAQHAIVMRGTADQVRVAEWAFNQLDKPAADQPQHASTPEFATNFQRNGASAVRLFTAENMSPETAADLVNSIRVVAEIQRCFPLLRSNAIVVAATPEQLALAQWVFDQLDRPKAGAPVPDYPVAGSKQQARVVYLPHAESQDATKELLNTLRSTASIQRAWSYARLNAIALRGTPEELALADKIIQAQR